MGAYGRRLGSEAGPQTGQEGRKYFLGKPTSAGSSLNVMKALLRDNFRCIISGAYDIDCINTGHVDPPNNALTQYTEAAHILPESMNKGLSSYPKFCTGSTSRV